MCECFMNMTPVFNIIEKQQGSNSILRRDDYGVNICLCSVRPDEYNIKNRFFCLLQSLQTVASAEILWGSH